MNNNLKDYVPVSVRLAQFRADHPFGRVITVMTATEPITFRAEVYRESDESPLATGHASENGGMGNNRDDSIEKVETASVGRALAFLGYEIKNGIASREEMDGFTPTEARESQRRGKQGQACGASQATRGRKGRGRTVQLAPRGKTSLGQDPHGCPIQDVGG